MTPTIVVLGETQDYSFDDFATAIGLIENGSHFRRHESRADGPWDARFVARLWSNGRHH